MRTSLGSKPPCWLPRRCPRGDFLFKVRYATIKDIKPFTHKEGVKEIAFMQAFDMMDSEHCCGTCNKQYKLVGIPKKSRAAEGDDIIMQYWWRQRAGGCNKCKEHYFTVAKGTLLSEVHSPSWMDFLEVATMWAMEYPKRIIMSEVSHIHHNTVERWIIKFQKEAAASVKDEIIFAKLKDHVIPYRTQSNENKPRGIFLKKPAVAKKNSDENVQEARVSEKNSRSEEACIEACPCSPTTSCGPHEVGPTSRRNTRERRSEKVTFGQDGAAET